MASKKDAILTPMMAQYKQIKNQYEDALLFYQMGDFYEMFCEDAIAASEALDIALTKRGKGESGNVPMCGVPLHSADRYLQLLIQKGFRVAVCVQTETPAEARKRGHKAVVEREVVRLITPGTLTEDSLLDAKRHNYVAAVHNIRNEYSLAWTDISSGELHVTNFPPVRLAPQLAKIAATEILHRESLIPQAITILKEACGSVTPLADIHFDSQHGKKRIEELFQVGSLDAFGEFSRSECSALGALIAYLEMTQHGKLPLLQPPQREYHDDTLQIDAATRKNLEITQNLAGERDNTLLSVLDDTKTASGARLLEKWLRTPSTNLGTITRRQKEVTLFLKNSDIRTKLRSRLRQVPDLHRALSRLGLDRGSPRDMNAIRLGLMQTLKLRMDVLSLEKISASRKAEIDLILTLEDLATELQQALVEQPPTTTREGGYITQGYDADLDAVRKLRNESHQFMADLQKKYVDLTDIPTLKIRFNNVLGHYIEIPSSHFEKMVSEPLSKTFTHRQSTASTSRFTSEELADLQTQILNAEAREIEIEQSIFDNFRETIIENSSNIVATAQTIAELDVTASLAEVAANSGWCQPVLNDIDSIDVRGGRHPVVEHSLMRDNQNPFIPNDCRLVPESRIILLTGPNMAGKSTYLRQNALIVLLAQIGSYVPAQEAKIGIVSQLFSRVGAADDLARGRSTFMVEMVETATILNTADSRALVIFDEVGRGTATNDGLSIAWATLEYIHDKVQCRTLFATHYHELTQLAGRLDSLTNATVRVKEWNGDVIFLHEVEAGTADRSYGVQVARLAGLPKAVVSRAQTILGKLEDTRATSRCSNLDLPLFASLVDEEPQSEPEPSAIEQKIGAVNPDGLTPLEALNLVYELKELQTRN